MYSKRYPERNRKATGLGPVDIEIQGEVGTWKTDPNGLIITAVTGMFPLEKIGKPTTSSMLSGEPAYLYRTSELEVALTGEEIRRLTRRDLHEQEFFKLREAFGLFFEIHEDFYDETTGEALQAKG